MRAISSAFLMTSAGLKLIFGSYTPGPTPESDLYLLAYPTLYPSNFTTKPELTLYNSNWTYSQTLTLQYKWDVSSSVDGPWTAVTSYATYNPGNPSVGTYNTLSYTPALDKYISGRVYFKFTMKATDAAGSPEYEAISDPITVAGPTWVNNPAFSGPGSTGSTLTWNTGKAGFDDVSTNVGYMTTIYKSNNGGITKTYLVGTATTPDFSFADYYDYSINLVDSDAGYTYYASTYAVYSTSGGIYIDAYPSETISGQQLITLRYSFDIGKHLYVSTNGYIGLTSGSYNYNAVPATGYNIVAHLADFTQSGTSGGNGSGFLFYWSKYDSPSNSSTYAIRWSGYLRTHENLSAYRVTYQVKFYTNQNYYDIKYIHVGASVYSTQSSVVAPGLYYNASLTAAGTTLPYPWFISTGATYRVYYDGSSPTSGISFVEVNESDMVNAGATTSYSSVVTPADDAYTDITTVTDQYTKPTIIFGSLTKTGTTLSVPLTGTFYSYDYTLRSGSYAGTIVAFGNNQTGTTISASGLTVGTTYYLTASPKNYWLQYGDNTQNNYTTSVLYTVTFNGNGNTSGSPSISSVTQTTEGGSVTLATVGTLAKTNYVFGGWNTLSDGSGTALGAASTYTPSSDITLYAKWNFSVTRTLSFDANGGTGAPSSQTGTDTGSGATITISATAPTRTGYSFAGWNTNSSGTGTNYSSSGSITISADTTLYAKWTAITYTVTWSANGGSVSPTSSTGIVGASVTPGTPTQSGFTFLYWRDDTRVQNYLYQINPGGSWTIGTGGTTNITFYAIWQAITPNISSITVTGNGNSTGTTGPGVTVTYSGTNIGSVQYILYARDTSTSAWVQKNSGTSNSTSLNFTSSQGTLPDQYYILLTPYYGTGGTGTAGTQRSTINSPKSNASGSITVNY